ncbi:MAG: hypothetical protein GX939_04765 [Clostridiaceae bacterium]|nr:hypothetical protein [Clostridiaceae bacterium]
MATFRPFSLHFATEKVTQRLKYQAKSIDGLFGQLYWNSWKSRSQKASSAAAAFKVYPLAFGDRDFQIIRYKPKLLFS